MRQRTTNHRTLVLGAALITSVAASANTLTYDTEEELRSASGFGPLASAEFVSRTTAACSRLTDDLRLAATNARDQWFQRNQDLLDRSAIVRQQMESEAIRLKLEQQFRTFRDVTFPKQMDVAANQYVAVLATTEGPEAKASLCRSIVQAVNARKMDIEVRDQAITGYLRSRVTRPSPALPTK